MLTFFAVSAVRAELLFEHHQGGPTEYRQAGINHAGEFEVTDLIRIQAVSGWFAPGSTSIVGPSYADDSALVGVSISETPFGSPVSFYTPTGPIDYSASFQLPPLPLTPPSELIIPGRWVTFGGLEWDLGPGVYNLNFFGAPMPLAYGYFGPVHDVAGIGPFYYNFGSTDYVGTDFPFGMRIYGRALAAVPEASAYGVVASLLLALTVMGRRARTPRDGVE